MSGLIGRLRSDRGFTTVELSVAGVLGSLALAVLATFLMNSVSTGTFTEGQSATLNNVRNVMQQIEKETRGADSIKWCEPQGSCLEVGAQTPTGSFRTVRYQHVGTDLEREVFDPLTATWSDPQPVVERVANTAEQKVFTCDSTVTLLRVTVDLHIQPTPASGPNLNVQTSLRPRNFAQAAKCPTP